MKQQLFLLIGFLIGINTTQAQQKEMHDAAVVFASEYCKCMQSYTKLLDKDVLNALVLMPQEEAEVDAYFNELL